MLLWNRKDQMSTVMKSKSREISYVKNRAKNGKSDEQWTKKSQEERWNEWQQYNNGAGKQIINYIQTKILVVASLYS